MYVYRNIDFQNIILQNILFLWGRCVSLYMLLYLVIYDMYYLSAAQYRYNMVRRKSFLVNQVIWEICMYNKMLLRNKWPLQQDVSHLT